MNENLRRHWRTALGAAVGGIGGGLYAHFIGCHTGTCLLTSTVWGAAAFFGLTGAIVAMPSARRDAPRARDGQAPT